MRNAAMGNSGVRLHTGVTYQYHTGEYHLKSIRDRINLMVDKDLCHAWFLMLSINKYAAISRTTLLL
jgi:hypothetical protein